MAVASHLARPTRSSSDPGRVSLLTWPCSDWGLPCRVRCRPRGGLLPHRFTLPLDKGRSVFCGPIRRLAAPRRYLAVCPTELGLSSMRQSSRRTATITPYRHPVPKLPAPEGWGQASAHEPAEQASHAVARQSRGVGTPRPPRARPPPHRQSTRLNSS